MRLPLACSGSPLSSSASTLSLFRASWLLLVAIAALWSSPCSGQVSVAEARQLGLESSWQSQMQLPVAGYGLVSSHLWTDAGKMRQYAVVELADRTIRVSADKLDRKGNPIGLAEAKKLASEQATRLMFGKSDGFEVLEVSVPQVNLVLVSRDGLVQNFDAETGLLLWAATCGRSGAPAHPAAVSTAGVTVIHGGELYLLDWASGKQLMNRQLRSGTSNAVAVCNDIAFVSDFTGAVEAYGLPRTLNPWSYILHGRAVGHPVSSADQMFSAIATTAGHMYVFTGGENPTLWLRYETSPSISGSLAAGNGAFYVASTNGVLGKVSVDNRLGTIEWEYRAGRTVTKPALIVGEQVFLATESGDLISIHDTDGSEQWRLSLARISSPLAVVADKIMCTTSSGRIVAFDALTGSVAGQTGVIELSHPVLNSLNDRLYLVTTTGQVQCLRPIDGVLPNFVAPIVPLEAVEETEEQVPSVEAVPAESNPFDAFGEPAAAGDSPFGGDADPDADTGGDPFGGDPFGGDPFGAD